ncbi:MAG: diacylglycerol kinase family protein [Planctomycetota bacterium]|nr:diacylglycerol kinase family protein [Planctomycetota bacterium]
MVRQAIRLMERVVVILNPVAGRGRAVELAERLRKGLLEKGAQVEVMETQAAGDGTRMGLGLSPEVEHVFVVGGDGTLREVAAGVLQGAGHAALGHIPLGNANVVARELGIPLDAKKAVEVLPEGRAESFDVLEVNGHLVLAMVGVGYDAHLAASMERARAGAGKAWYRVHGDSLYGAVGAFHLLKPELRRFRLLADGRPLEGEFTGCTVSNMRTYAKGWAPNPDADPQDGWMNYQALKPGWMPSTVLSLIAAARHRPLPERLAARGSATSMVIRADKEFPWQADGDSMGMARELNITLRPGCLRLLVPKTTQ